jgi:hypothetical protein
MTSSAFSSFTKDGWLSLSLGRGQIMKIKQCIDTGGYPRWYPTSGQTEQDTVRSHYSTHSSSQAVVR